MFRKKKDDEKGIDKPAGGYTEDIDAPPLKPFSRKGSHIPGKPPSPAAIRPDLPRRVVDIPGSPRLAQRNRPSDADSKRLIVGRDICLSGEITSCDKLVVEGRVEASLTDARAIEVSSTGFFKGDAQVEEADISGRYEGTLVAHDKLTVRASGRISGSIRYGRIVIESGGEIAGEMQSLGHGEPAADGAGDGADTTPKPGKAATDSTPEGN